MCRGGCVVSYLTCLQAVRSHLLWHGATGTTQWWQFFFTKVFNNVSVHEPVHRRTHPMYAGVNDV